MISIIDLHFQTDHSIASFLVETADGPVLVETGPHSTYPKLVAGLAAHGYKPSDIKHVLLTHIHFDHAGAAWAFAKEGATVYVHPRGYRHLHDPEKLYNSAKMIYGDMMETLWGLMEGIPESQMRTVEHQEVIEVGGKRFIAHHTPGHAVHHIAWQMDDIIFTGDVAGCKIDPGPVVPPCPPPDINLEDWYDSIDLLRGLAPRQLYLTHFGPISDVNTHLDALKKVLKDWGDWMKIRYDQGLTAQQITPDFQAYAAAALQDLGLSANELARYEAANPAWMSVAGLLRYWKKRESSGQ